MNASRIAPALVAGILGSFLATPVPNARACSPRACVDGEALPPLGGSLPKSAPAIPLAPGYDVARDGGRATFTLTKVGGAAIPFTLGTSGGNILPLLPGAPLEAGASYRIEADSGCSTAAPITLTTFDVTADAPLPTTLGTLTIGASTIEDIAVEGATDCSSTSETISAATATVDLALSDAAKPWKDVFLYTTLVDGSRWAPSQGPSPAAAPLGGSWKGRGKDLLYAACGDAGSGARGLGEGTHKVQIQAAILGSDKVVSSDEQTVTLRCNAGPADAGADASPDGSPDASPDASTPDGGGKDAGSSGGGSDDGGCSASPGAPTSASALFSGAIAALAFVARRRRSARATSRT